MTMVYIYIHIYIYIIILSKSIIFLVDIAVMVDINHGIKIPWYL